MRLSIISLIFVVIAINCKGVLSKWESTLIDSVFANYLSATWPSAGTAIVAGYSLDEGYLIRTTDYGYTWNRIASNSKFDPLFDIVSNTLTDNNIYYLAVSETGIAYTSTGDGLVWSNHTQPVQLYSATIGSNGESYICGDAFAIYRTTLPQISWTEVTPNGGDTCYGISTYDGVNVIAVGSLGTIYYSSDSGSSWTLSSGVTDSFLYSIAHGSSSVAIIGGLDGFVARTNDYGATWTSISPFSSSYLIRYHSISFISVSDVYIAGYRDSEQDGAIYSSSDGGTTWTLMDITDHQLLCIAMYNSEKGIAGSDGRTGIYSIVPGNEFYISRVYAGFPNCSFVFFFLLL